MPLPERDVFSIVYSGLWDVLEASSAFCALVPETNRIKYVDDTDGTKARRSPDKQGLVTSDYPQVTIVPTGGPTDTYWSSDGTRVGMHFQIWIKTGDQRLSYAVDDTLYQGLFPIQWSILRAMMDWEATLKPLTWGGVAGFITHCAPHTREEKMSQSAVKQPVTTGWFLAWDGIIDTWFDSSKILASIAP